jgi:hypothetical protein
MKKYKAFHQIAIIFWVGLWGNTCRPGVWLRNLVWVGLVVGGMIGAEMTATPVRAQGVGEATIDAPLVDASHGLRAYRQVEAWLRGPSEARQGVGPIRVTGLIGVRLVMRSEGIVVGEGTAYRGDVLAALDGPGEAVDLIPILLLATERAEVGVRESLADTRLRAVLAGRSLPDTKELTVADISANLNVELELGYGLRTITVPVDADREAVFARFAPCYHGLAFVDAKRGAWSWVWPGEAISRNISPSSQLALGLKGLGMEREAIKDLARQGGPGLARFRTVHIVRPYSGAQPTELVRSSIRQPRYAVSERELVSMGDRLVEHLLNRFTSDDRVRGTYHPTSGRFDPAVAVDGQAALACYAVVHYSRYLIGVRPEDKSPLVYARRATRLASQMVLRLLDSQEQVGPRVLALVLMTLLEAPESESDQALRDRLGEQLLERVLLDGADGEAGMNSGEAALVSAALASLYERTREEKLGEAVWALMQRQWAEEGRVPNLAALPWLALAQERAGGLLVDADASGDRRAELDRWRTTMSRVIEVLCKHQVIEKPELGPDDVLGGFVLTPGPEGSPPNPDWRNAQPLMFISIMLRDEQATKGRDKLGWLLSAGYSARFVGQLMMDDSSCYYVRDRVGARGGVRMAPWDNRLALAPAAMSLLAVTELQTSLATFKPTPPEPQTQPVQSPEAESEDATLGVAETDDNEAAVQPVSP